MKFPSTSTFQWGSRVKARRHCWRHCLCAVSDVTSMILGGSIYSLWNLNPDVITANNGGIISGSLTSLEKLNRAKNKQKKLLYFVRVSAASTWTRQIEDEEGKKNQAAVSVAFDCCWQAQVFSYSEPSSSVKLKWLWHDWLIQAVFWFYCHRNQREEIKIWWWKRILSLKWDYMGR